MKKLLTILTAAFCILSSSVSASEFDSVVLSNINLDNELTISGSVGNEHAHKNVAVIVYAPTKTFDDFSDAQINNSDFLQVVVFNDQTGISKDGTFEFVMELGEESGVYDIWLSSDIDGFSAVNKKVGFCSFDDAKTAIEMINNASDAEQIYTDVMTTEPYVHLFNIPVFKQNDMLYSDRRVADYLYALKQEQSINADKKYDFVNTYSVIALMDALNNGSVNDISAYISLLKDTSHSKTFEIFEETKDAELGQAVANGLSNKNFTDTSEFLNKLDEMAALEIIYKADAYGDVSKVLNTYKDEIGISDSQISKDVCIKIKGKSFANFSELKTFITNEENTSGGSSSNGGESSGGGRKTGGSSGGGVSISNDYLSNVQNNVCGFKDVLKDAWYAQAVESLYNKKVISGRTKDIFCPDEFVTREEFVKMAAVLFGIKYLETELPFNDVNKSEWYYDYVVGAYAKGIIKGISENEFGIGQSVTRQDVAVILNNIFEKTNITVNNINADKVFADDYNISNYAREAIYKMQAAGIINGYTDNTFLPKNAVTRAEAAKLLEAAMKISESQAVIQ